MRIMLVYQPYLQPGAPGHSRFNEYARLWQAQGHEVEVIAGQNSYISGRRGTEYRGKWVATNDEAGITVHRAYAPDTYFQGYIGRMWAFFAFMFSASTAAIFNARRPDVVIASSPPLIAGIPGVVAAFRWRRKLVFEVRDLWPESAITVGVIKRNGMLARLLYKLEAGLCRWSDQINVLTPAFMEDIVGRGLASSDKMAFTPNGADTERFSPGSRDNAVRQRFGWGDKFVVMYAGAHGRANHLTQLLETAEELRDHPEVVIAMVGDGLERSALQAEAARRGLTNIQFLGSFPKEEMPAVLQACDAGIAVLKRIDTFKTVYPNKVFDYMACGKPIIIGIDGIARRMVVDEAQAGVFAEPEDPRAIADAILSLAHYPATCARFAKNGRAFVVSHFSRERLAQAYLDGLTRVVA